MCCAKSAAEVQRPQRKMSRCLFSTFCFLILMMCYSICGPVYADKTILPNKIDVLVAGKTKINWEREYRRLQPYLLLLRTSSIAVADGVMTVVAIGTYDRSEGNDIVEASIETVGTDWVKRLTENNGGNWKTQTVYENSMLRTTSYANHLVAVAKNKTIYVLATHGTFGKDYSYAFKTFVGNIEYNDVDKKKIKKIAWESPTNDWKLTDYLRQRGLLSYCNEMRGFITDDGTIVYIIKAKKLQGFEYVPAIIHSETQWWDTRFVLSYVGDENDCSIFPWKGKFIKFTGCQDGIGTVMESSNFGGMWKAAVGPFSRLWEYLRFKRDFFAVIIENQTVLLSTLFSEIKTRPKSTYQIHLWFTDGDRVHNAGLLYSGTDYVYSQGFAYTNGELFSLQRINEYDNQAVFLTHSKDGLEKIKFVLSAWKKANETVSQLCRETTASRVSCTTDGLVGFLSNNTNENNTSWHDEYLFANATVRGGTKVENGFAFSGVNAGAKWTIGTEGENRWYNFSRYGLTLVATVTIDSVSEDKVPLLTFGWDNINGEHDGLWYGKDGQWKIVSGNGKDCGAHWKEKKAYRVELTLQDNNIVAYIDGTLVGYGQLQTPASGEKRLPLKNVFIGSYDVKDTATTASHLKVTNVLLFNRPLNNLMTTCKETEGAKKTEVAQKSESNTKVEKAEDKKETEESDRSGEAKELKETKRTNEVREEKEVMRPEEKAGEEKTKQPTEAEKTEEEKETEESDISGEAKELKETKRTNEAKEEKEVMRPEEKAGEEKTKQPTEAEKTEEPKSTTSDQNLLNGDNLITLGQTLLNPIDKSTLVTVDAFLLFILTMWGLVVHW